MSFDSLVLPEDAEAAIEFLTSNEWPFHGSPHLRHDQAAQVRVAGDDIASFWIRADAKVIPKTQRSFPRKHTYMVLYGME